ncbi:MAG TPA: cytochrome c oxidase subunit II [Gaiellaceae bacterium]|nr:cytochrome c oxidase subunit II [Gaiellaceae bacterium]
MRRIALAILVTSVAALSLAAVALAGNAGFLPASPHSPNAHRVTDAFIFVAGFTGAIFLLVEGALILFVVKYRRGKRAATAEGPQIHGATRLEIIWTVIPVLILAAIGTFVFYKLPGITDAPKASAANETTITIEGHQFYWLFRYPNGAISINTMVAPAHEVVHEDIVGLPYDVNHSWWVPELGGKYDAIPGKTNKTWFDAPVGSYVARCAELCGIQHALMDGTVKVVPRAQYKTFISNRASAAGTMALGKEEWQGVCEKCHRLDHQYIGPAIGGNSLLTNRTGLESLLRNGESGSIGVMPAVGKNWTGHQIDALIAYTKTLPK